MSLTCTNCSSKRIAIKQEKVFLGVLGSVVLIPIAAAFGLKAGLIALFIAACKGNANAANLLRVKLKLMQESQRLGSFFYCEDCKRDLSLEDVFHQVTGK